MNPARMSRAQAHWLDDAAAFAAAQQTSAALAREWQAAADAVFATALAGDASDPEAMATAAEALLADTGWLGDLLAPLVVAVRADPRVQPPLRVRRDALRFGAVLYDGPAAIVTATILRGDALAAEPAPRTVAASGRLAVVRYHRAAGARLSSWRVGPDVGAHGDAFSAATAPPCIAEPSRLLADGDIVRLDGRTHAHHVGRDAVGADIVSISVTFRSFTGAFARKYDLFSGKPVQVAALDEAASRTHMLLTFLRLSGAAHAGEVFDAATRDSAFSLRWTAMREWLALDWRAALPRLRAMVDDPHAEVRAAARTTLIQLETLCPA